MANYRAVANGNWDNLATWQDNGGGSFAASTVLPGINDDVYANNFNVNIDINTTVLSIRNTSATGITAGGRFFPQNGVTVNVTGTGLVNNSVTTILIEFNLPSPNQATIITSQLGGTGGNPGTTNAVVSLTNTGTINVIGSWTLNNNVISITGNGTFNLTGNGGHASVISSQNGIVITAANAILNWTGNLTFHGASTVFAYISGSGAPTTSTVNMIGNIIGGTSVASPGIWTNGIFNLTGTAEPHPTSTSSPAVLGGSGSQITINGITQSNNNRALAVSSTGLVTILGQINCLNEGWPISAARLRLVNANTTQITFQTDSVGINKTLYEPGTVLGNPAITDVRAGVIYGSGALTGTLIVPDPSDVRKSVPTDDTVGSAELTAQDLFDAIAASSDPVAIRLRNCATVATTGDQIAAVVA